MSSEYDRNLMSWHKINLLKGHKRLSLYRRISEPTWKRKGKTRVVVRFLPHFPDNIMYQIFLPELSYEYSYDPCFRKTSPTIIEQLFCDETLSGVMFYADLKAIELGFKINDPFTIPKDILIEYNE